jgi:hypothetical protein
MHIQTGPKIYMCALIYVIYGNNHKVILNLVYSEQCDAHQKMVLVI